MKNILSVCLFLDFFGLFCSCERLWDLGLETSIVTEYYCQVISFFSVRINLDLQTLVKFHTSLTGCPTMSRNVQLVLDFCVGIPLKHKIHKIFQKVFRTMDQQQNICFNTSLLVIFQKQHMLLHMFYSFL